MTALDSPVVATSILTAARRRRSDRGSLGELAYQQIKDKIVSLDLPPASVGEGTYTTTVAVPGGRPRTIVIAEARPGVASVTVQGPRIGARRSGSPAWRLGWRSR